MLRTGRVSFVTSVQRYVSCHTRVVWSTHNNARLKSTVKKTKMTDDPDRRKRQKLSMAQSGNEEFAQSAPASIVHTVGSSFSVPGLHLTDHTFKVPLDYSDPTGPQLNLFVREVVAPTRNKLTSPCLLYLQGRVKHNHESSASTKTCIDLYKIRYLSQHSLSGKFNTPHSTSFSPNFVGRERH